MVSLFSGLGGAELAMQNIYMGVCKVCKETGLDPPKQPRCLAFLVVDMELAFTCFFDFSNFSVTAG